ncbi:hypothetical protein [Kineococcus arenarius]|uniref:hypothetical protein n=1 Tax=unclassified Kineococcus TaxID=2621656 RepID=UPI003D7CC0E9
MATTHSTSHPTSRAAARTPLTTDGCCAPNASLLTGSSTANGQADGGECANGCCTTAPGAPADHPDHLEAITP